MVIGQFPPPAHQHRHPFRAVALQLTTFQRTKPEGPLAGIFRRCLPLLPENAGNKRKEYSGPFSTSKDRAGGLAYSTVQETHAGVPAGIPHDTGTVGYGKFPAYPRPVSSPLPGAGF